MKTETNAMTRKKNIDRYLRIVRWARNRYKETTKDGFWIVDYRGNIPSRYVQIERAAWERYV